MEFRYGLHVLKALPALIAPSGAVAADYLTEEEAQRVLFPAAASFEREPAPDEAVLGAASKKARSAAWSRAPKIWLARGEGPGASPGVLGRVVVDQVIGKHDFITYAVGVSADGTVVGVEILSYREVYGGEVRNERWRRQFKGKKTGDPLRFPLDIKNITGATLSCRHVTEGVRRILALLNG